MGYIFFKNEFPTKFHYASIEEQIIVLAEKNKQHFLDVINLAKEKYLADLTWVLFLLIKSLFMTKM